MHIIGDDRYSYPTSWGTRFADGSTTFRLWAPSAQRIDLVSEPNGGERRLFDMQRDDAGWWQVSCDQVAVGGAYGFRVDGDTVVPDPAARAQMGGVHSLSKLVDPTAYAWRTKDWNGRPWEEAVFYELHTGTFTPEGTFAAIIDKLDYLKQVGITAIELLPVAQFAGRRGWGYDSVLLYCPHQAYGGVAGLKQLVDAAHERGLMVFLDVVYNHFGPDGNYIGAYASSFFHQDIHTAWGAAIAYEEQPVRDFMIENALFWLQEYRIDGLRLDAIDSIRDTTDTPLVQELAARVRAAFPGRHVHLTTEDDRNISWHVERGPQSEALLISGEWNDDFHHCAHVLATHETEGYYADYSRQSVEQMARSLATGFVFQGQHSDHRNRDVGTSSAHLPPTAFVNFLQNHDQIGNRAFGDRLTTLASQRMVECLDVILLLSPQIPLLFMGEEYGETRPFSFFTDFHGELADLVREGRRNEFKKFAVFHDADQRKLIPDPNAAATFEACKLDWDAQTQPIHHNRLVRTQQLLQKRQASIVPLLKGAPANGGASHSNVDTRAFTVSWTLNNGAVLLLFANLDEQPWSVPNDVARVDLGRGALLHSHPKGAADALETGVLPGLSVVFRLDVQRLFAGTPG